MTLNRPDYFITHKGQWDRLWAAHHLNEIERQVDAMERHTVNASPTSEGCEKINELCARLTAMKGEQAEKEAA